MTTVSVLAAFRSSAHSRRFLLLVTGCVLVALSASAAWLALTTRGATDDAARAAKLDQSYQQSRYSLAQLMVLARDTELSGDVPRNAQFPRLVTSLDKSLRSVARQGTALDRRQFSALRNQIPLLFRQIETFTGDVSANNFAKASAAYAQLASTQAKMETVIEKAGARHRARTVEGFHAARRAETVVFAETLFAAALGILLVLAGVRIVRYKESLDEAQAAELERLRGAALTDNLTQLPNHRAFHELLDAQLDRGTAVTLVSVDLDGLKQVNDTAGHQAGDEIIRALADGLRRTIHDDHVACRIGGDEFAVILPESSAMDGFYLAQNLREELRNPTSGAPPVGATAGIADTADGTDKDGLIRRSDLALIEAKRAHRGALVYSADLETVLDPHAIVSRHHVATLASALARAVDAKDAYTHSHCETVAELCAMIATELGLAPERVAQVRLAGLLHDVGKIGISDAILQKPGPLTDEEFRVMRTHPSLGSHIVSAAELYQEAGWIHHHHERVDGRGYPDGLGGKSIPLESRIIMVADAFEAITADRPYRDRRSVSEALVELNRHAGTQFDITCLRALERIITGGAVVIRPVEAIRLVA